MSLLKALTSNIFSAFRESKEKDDTCDGQENELNENDNSIRITEEYKEAIACLENKKEIVFVTGKAGTGKSTFIKYLRENINVNTAVIAPTGVAALNVNGQTIHSFFHIPPRIIDPTEIKPLRSRKLFEALKILIIDEISMVRADLMDLIDISLRKNTGKEEKAFGGVQIVVVGDLFQLPPVIASQTESRFISSKYKSPFFLSSYCMHKTRPQIIELTKIFRQKDEEFIQLLSNIREGNSPLETVSEFNRRCFVGNAEESDAIILTPDNSSAGRINHARLAKIDAKEHEYEGVVTGQFNIENDRLPAPIKLVLKTGAHVMFTKNDSTHRWVNGTLGIIKELTPRYIIVDVKGATMTVARETWESIRYEYDEEKNQITSKVIGTYSQFPLMLAWAITIHKSQGKTFENIHIDVSRGAFADGQIYVALSRCRTLEGISLIRPLKVEDVKVNPVIKEFYDSLKLRTEIN